MSLFVIIGLGFFAGAYLAQRSFQRRSKFVRLPRGLAWLLGSSHDEKVDMWWMIIQIICLIWILGGSFLPVTGMSVSSQLRSIGVFSIIALPSAIGIAIWTDWLNRRELKRAIDKSIRPMLQPFGFAKIIDKPSLVVFDSKHCCIRLHVHLWNGMIITLEPKGDIRPTPGKGASATINLLFIVHYLDGKPIKYYLLDFRMQEIADAVRKGSEQLRDFCSPMLEGDFSRWSEIQDAVRNLKIGIKDLEP